jgi:pimeloyl-ACP methyl ester carboxylesterase
MGRVGRQVTFLLLLFRSSLAFLNEIGNEYVANIVARSHSYGSTISTTGSSWTENNVRRKAAQVKIVDDKCAIDTHPAFVKPSVCRQSKVWRFRNHPISYQVSSTMCNQQDSSTTSETSISSIVLLNGFGVGYFHQDLLIDAVFEREHWLSHNREQLRVFGMDYLGQGHSWPQSCSNGDSSSEYGLRYCGTTWVEQIISFLEEVVLSYDPADGSMKPKAHLVGNSLGGHLAVFVAAARPHLVETITLLNATPVWGLGLPGWTGHLPPPPFARRVGQILFEQIRQPATIWRYLKAAYVNPSAIDANLVAQIRECTESNGGHAAFASILWSPPVTIPSSDGKNMINSFFGALSHLQCDVLLVYGEDDLWCKPAIARQTMKRLTALHSATNRGMVRYVGLSNVGHCPNHEAPQAVASILMQWLKYAAKDIEHISLHSAGSQEDAHVAVRSARFYERWGTTNATEYEADAIPVPLLDRIQANFFEYTQM